MIDRQNRTNTTPRKRAFRRAMSLLEVVLALAILAVASAYLAQSMQLATQNAIRAQRLTKAELVAESVMNQVIAGVIPAQAVTWTPYYSASGQSEWMYQLQMVPTEVDGMLGLQVAVQQLDPLTGLTQTSYDLYANRWIIDPQLGLDTPPATTEEETSSSGSSSSSGLSSGGGAASGGGSSSSGAAMGGFGGFAPGGGGFGQGAGGAGRGGGPGGGPGAGRGGDGGPGGGGARPGGAGGGPGGGRGAQGGGNRGGGGGGPQGGRGAGGGGGGAPGGGGGFGGGGFGPGGPGSGGRGR